MPANIWFGFFRSNVVAQGGAISFGINIIQNRNSTKQNNGNYAISGGFLAIPVVNLVNYDADIQDSWNYDNNNFVGPQI